MKIEKYCISPTVLWYRLFSQHLFFSFLVSYKRGLRSLSGFHSGKLVMLMSIFKVCSGRATNDLFSLPIHCQCESLFHELLLLIACFALQPHTRGNQHDPWYVLHLNQYTENLLKSLIMLFCMRAQRYIHCSWPLEKKGEKK